MNAYESSRYYQLWLAVFAPWCIYEQWFSHRMAYTLFLPIEWIVLAVGGIAWFIYELWWWKEVGGRWPRVKISRRGTVRVTIPRISPWGYRRERFYSLIFEGTAAALWLRILYNVFVFTNRHNHIPEPNAWKVTAWLLVTLLCIGRIQRVLMERRISDHDKAPRRAIIRIKNGQMTWGWWPFRKKVRLSDVHSVTYGEHKERLMEKDGAIVAKPAHRVPHVFWEASAVNLRLGPSGERCIPILELANDMVCFHAIAVRDEIQSAIEAAGGSIKRHRHYQGRSDRMNHIDPIMLTREG
jgi:hypothetical protein